MTNHEVSKKIRQARPRLRDVAPLTTAIVVGYAFMNTTLGVLLFLTQARTRNLVVVNDVLTYQFWGTCFVILGLAMFIALKMNVWSVIKKTLIVGVFLKSWWLFALIVRLLSGHQENALLLCIWLFLTYIQVVTYIHFIPSSGVGKTKKEDD